jgi:hypothetical protein
VTNLDEARRKGISDLAGAKRAAGQAAAADGLARAHKAAGAALAPLTSAGDGLPSATVGALAATATAYTELASAARARSPKPYAEASRAVIGADADLRRTMTKVTAMESASTRNATRVSRPAAPTPAATRPLSQVGPVGNGGHGTDLTAFILLLLGATGIFIAVRHTLRHPR